MTREQVVEILTHYREDAAKVEYYKAKLNALNRQLRIARSEMIIDTQNITAQLTGMPHGTGISDQTANIAIKIADGWQTQRVAQIREQVQRLQDKLSVCQDHVVFAQSWLRCLTERQRYVVQHKTLKGAFIRDVIIGMQGQFGQLYGKQNIKMLQKTAIDIICRLVIDD